MMDNLEPMHEEDLRPPPLDAAQAQETAAPDPEPEPEAFWGYVDLCLFVCLAVLGLLAGALFVRIEAAVFHFVKPPVAALLPAQLVTYALLFGGLRFIFRVSYGRPLWRSLGWTPEPFPAQRVVIAGVGTAVMVMIGGALIHLPDTSNPMTELLQEGNLALVLLAIFGVGIAPLFEELAFRGFLQPLLGRSFGTPAGILIAGVAFGLLHFEEYGNSWRHALLLSGAGACFGWVRQITKSTKAAVLMHASYNGLLFLLLAIALFVERNQHH